MSNSANSKARFSPNGIICILHIRCQKFRKVQCKISVKQRNFKKKKACRIERPTYSLYLIWKEEYMNFKERNRIFKYRFITNHYFNTYKKHNAIASSDSISFKHMIICPLQKRLRRRNRLKFSIQEKRIFSLPNSLIHNWNLSFKWGRLSTLSIALSKGAFCC